MDAVSGATMTSMAVGEAAVIRAQLELDKRGTGEDVAEFPLKVRDVATLIAIVFGCFIAFTHSKAKRRLRIVLQVYLVAVLGLWVGDMLSLALMGGWAMGAVPWKSAPGLVALVAVALVLPWATGKPVYCLHMCPHGAAQELLFRIIPGRIHLPRAMRRVLQYLPGALLVAAIAIVGLDASISLSALEAFDAWVVRSCWCCGRLVLRLWGWLLRHSYRRRIASMAVRRGLFLITGAPRGMNIASIVMILWQRSWLPSRAGWLGSE